MSCMLLLYDLRDHLSYFMCFSLNVLILKSFHSSLRIPWLRLSVSWCSFIVICGEVFCRRKMGVTRRAWERISYIRWSQAEVPTGAREEH